MRRALIFLVAGLVFLISNAAFTSANHVSCGDTIMNDTVLDSDLICAGDGLIIGADGITLDCNGHTITGPSYYSNKGIIMSDKRDVEIKNCNIEYFSYGMDISGSESSLIKDNTARHNHVGFYIPSSTNNTLINNNASSNNALGIRLHGSRDHVLIRNIANSNGAFGIFVYGGYARHTLIGNTANSNGRGIQLEFAADNIVDGNTIMFNTWDGILLYASNGNTIKNNIISRNYEKGIKIMVNSNSNLIYNNYFNNTINAFDDNKNNLWWVVKTKETNIVGGPLIAGNFWHDYNGQDTNGDGIGDTNIPYNSNGNIAIGGDYFPLVERKMRTIV